MMLSSPYGSLGYAVQMSTTGMKGELETLWWRNQWSWAMR